MVTVPHTPRSTSVALAVQSAGPFLVGFRLFDADGLTVYVNGEPTSSFTVAASFEDGFTDSASISLTQPSPAGTTIRIEGDSDARRDVDYVPTDPSVIQKINVELGRVWATLIEQQRDNRRSLRVFDEAKPWSPAAGSVPLWDGAKFINGPSAATIAQAEAFALRAEAAADIALSASNFTVADIASLEASTEAFPLGSKILTRGEGFSYEVVETGESLTTAGGVKLKALGGGLARVGSYRMQPHNEGGYYSVDYSSDRSDINQYGYTANVKRTGGSKRPVAAQLNAYSLDPAGSAATSVFGIACEAWTGDFSTAPLVAAGLKGIEPAVISQYHANDQNIWGVDIVFKNRRDGGTILHGSIGDNAFNRYSHAVHISAQGRSALGEYCGWNKGIYFAASSLDASVDGSAIGIDFQDAPSARMSHAMLLADSMSIGLSAKAASGANVSMRYLDSVGRVQFKNGATSPVELMVSGGVAGVAINGVKVLGGQGAAITDAASGTEITTINTILARMRAHGLIAS